MDTHELITGLLAQALPEKRKDRARHDELGRIIDALERRQDDLRHRLARETRHAEQHHLRIALGVAELQHRKAVALRMARQ